MSSLRNTAVLRHTEADSDNPLLDAARTHLLAVGWKRATLTDIARTAGVSRMTIYRRWPDMPSLLADLMTREWTRVGREAGVLVEGEGELRERIARAVVAAARGLRSNEVFRRIVEVDPEVLLTYLIDRRGRSQDLLLELLEQAMTEGQRDGSVRGDVSPDQLAVTVLLATHGFAVSAGTMADLATEDEQAAELRDLLSRYLAP